MISIRSVQQFVLINSFITFCATLHHVLFGPSFVGSVIKHGVLYAFISISTRNKPWINSNILTSLQTFPTFYFIIGVGIDAISHIGMEYLARNTPLIPMYYWIPYLFVFDIVFDLFHYWTHRVCHSIPFLYRNVHKTHHGTYPIHAAVTFQHHPLDLILTNLIPLLLSSFIVHLDPFTVTLLLWYKTMQEIAGHSGKLLKGSSFIPCIWLSRWLGIELYSHNHDLHHRLPAWNFSKRFSLWDKVFGTFYQEHNSLERK